MKCVFALKSLCAGSRLLEVLGGCCLKKHFCDGYIPNFGLPPEIQLTGRYGLVSFNIKTGKLVGVLAICLGSLCAVIDSLESWEAASAQQYLQYQI